MRTAHEVVVGDARSMDALADGSVELVVTSPPYPMIEMWDDVFAALSDDVAAALDADDGDAAFDAMHAVLDAVWDEVERVLAPGGIACINVGDATRSLARFRQYPNHARVLDAFRERGFDVLPDVLWRKPTNSAAKFMGSGTLPPNAYVTLEHEYVLVFRKGARRSFDPGADRRYEAAYFWEERNEWFSDVWEDVAGTRQSLDGDAAGLDDETRERSAAFPLAIPYRLVNMYSVYGDTVLDPFWGTGTTTVAAMVAGRNSVGYERDAAFVDAFDDRVGGVPERSRAIVGDRLAAHESFVTDREAAGDPPGYEATHYDTRVVTKTERDLRLYVADGVESGSNVTADSGLVGDPTRGYAVSHVPTERPDAVDVVGEE